MRIDYRLSIIDYRLLIIDYRLSIIDYQLTFVVVFSGKASGGSSFRKKHLFFFETFYKTRRLRKLVFFVILRTLNPRFSPKLAPTFRFPPLHRHGALPHTTSLIQLSPAQPRLFWGHLPGSPFCGVTSVVSM